MKGEFVCRRLLNTEKNGIFVSLKTKSLQIIFQSYLKVNNRAGIKLMSAFFYSAFINSIYFFSFTIVLNISLTDRAFIPLFSAHSFIMSFLSTRTPFIVLQ